jgi:hypothetical protein
LFATGLVAGGAVAGVIVAFIGASASGEAFLKSINTEEGIIHSIHENGYKLLGVLFFAAMAYILYRVATNNKKMQ